MPTSYLDPKVDLSFKRVFGEHEHLLRSFLNALLPLPEDCPIEKLEYLTPEQVPEIPGLLKNSIVDVKCTDTAGRIFIVEMQMLWSPSFQKRIVFGGAQAYVKQLKKGQDYRGLQPVYALALTNGVFDHSTDSYYHHYQIVNLENTQERLEGLQFVFIELPKFKPSNRVQRQMQVLWLRFMSEIGEGGIAPDADMMGNTDIASALELVNMASFSEEELAAYHAGLDKWRIETSLLGDAKAAGLAEGMEKGIEQGISQGIEKGIERGIEKGMEQAVKAMARSGMRAAQISQILQLPEAQVQAILSL